MTTDTITYPVSVAVSEPPGQVVVQLGSDALASLTLNAATAAAASAGIATQVLADITTLLTRYSSSMNIITDQVTNKVYRLILVDGLLMKEEIDPGTIIITGARGLFGVLTGL